MRILVVEDEAKVLALVKEGLEEHGFSVTGSRDGDEATRLVASVPFDAIILDVMLPGRDGLSLLKKLRMEKNPVPVILLTARGDLSERLEGLDLGADDYLPKPFAVSELVARLRAVLRRNGSTAFTIQTLANMTINYTTRQVWRGQTRLELTPREYALLECLLRSPGKVVTRVELTQAVWGHQFDAGTNFVEVAIQRLRKKVDGPFSPKLIQTVRGIGYAVQVDS